MSLPHAYSNKTDSIPQYFDALLQIQPPDVFDAPFLARLNFKNFIDRSFIAILEELKFITSDGKPTPRYLDFLDPRKSKKIITEGINTAYSAIIHADINPHTMEFDDIFKRSPKAVRRFEIGHAGCRHRPDFYSLIRLRGFQPIGAGGDGNPCGATNRYDTARPGHGRRGRPLNPPTRPPRPPGPSRTPGATPRLRKRPRQNRPPTPPTPQPPTPGRPGTPQRQPPRPRRRKCPWPQPPGTRRTIRRRHRPAAPRTLATPRKSSRGPPRDRKKSRSIRCATASTSSLPETRDPAVYDAIFTSLKKNLLTTHRENRDTSYA